jgi:RND family efflux transporter MFP subunit
MENNMSTVTELREKNNTENTAAAIHEIDKKPSTAPVRKKPIVGILQVTAVVMLIVLAFVYSRAPDQAASPATAQAPAQALTQKPSSPASTAAPLVTIVKPIMSSQQLAITSTGSVSVRSYVTLTPQVSGKVVSTSTALRNGGRFSAGETLVALEQRDFILALAQVQADVASAQASLQLSLAEGSAALSNYQLLKPGKTPPPLVAKEPQIAQARAQLQSAIARRDIQQTNLERSVFSLPFSGRVVESSADEGQILSVGQSFGRVYALDAVEVVISLAPAELAKIAPAENRLVTISAEGTTFTGRVDRVAAERDSRSRFSQIFITIDGNQPLTPGTFVSVKLNGPMLENTFMLPESALQVGQVFWIVKNGSIAEVPAKILGRSDGQYLVKAFEYDQGIIIGAVPGAKYGLPVRLAGTE